MMSDVLVVKYLAESHMTEWDWTFSIYLKCISLHLKETYFKLISSFQSLKPKKIKMWVQVHTVKKQKRKQNSSIKPAIQASYSKLLKSLNSKQMER